MASCALLGSAARAQEPSTPLIDRLLDGVSVNSAVAYYHENGRIQAVEPVVDISKTFANGQVLNANATFDVLSGASPNGALASRSAQTFASPSGTSLTGKHAYTIRPGQYPVDPHYQDDRFSGAVNWDAPLTRLTTLSLGGKLSDEDDFLSLTASAGVSHDFNDKNTTVSIGVSNEYDRLSPIGGTPVAGSNYALFDKTGGQTKDGVAALLGVTQVLTRNWISSLNLSVDRFKGYLNDPYKITSVLDAAGNTLEYVYENRPDQRTRKSVYLENRAAASQFSAALSLRYMQDNWQVRSDTVQLNLRWTPSERDRYLEPTVRWYRQSAAFFYTPWLSDAGKVPEFQSSDERLGAMHALTYGLKYEQTLAHQETQRGWVFNVRLEYYQQTFDQPEVPTSLQGLNLLPPLKALLFQVGGRF
ncbi:MAG TPA: DUF3570 domain-containing protein [Steroidobacteraceae bacterium]